MENWKKDSRKAPVIVDIEALVPKDHLLRKIEKVRWIAKVTSSLHDLLPVFQKSCKTKFRETKALPANPEVNFTNIVQTGIYSYKGN